VKRLSAQLWYYTGKIQCAAIINVHACNDGNPPPNLTENFIPIELPYLWVVHVMNIFLNYCLSPINALDSTACACTVQSCSFTGYAFAMFCWLLAPWSSAVEWALCSTWNMAKRNHLYQHSLQNKPLRLLNPVLVCIPGQLWPLITTNAPRLDGKRFLAMLRLLMIMDMFFCTQNGAGAVEWLFRRRCYRRESLRRSSQCTKHGHWRRFPHCCLWRVRSSFTSSLFWI
jgi:hypothetical protein